MNNLPLDQWDDKIRDEIAIFLLFVIITNNAKLLDFQYVDDPIEIVSHYIDYRKKKKKKPIKKVGRQYKEK